MRNESPEEWLARWKSEAAKPIAKPYIQLIASGDGRAIEAALGQLARELLKQVQEKVISGEVADAVFTILYVYVGDYGHQSKLSEIAMEILLEGMTFCCFDHPHGPDSKYLEQLIKKAVDDKGTPPKIAS